MLSCIEITRLATDHLEGRLSFLVRTRFQLHLGLCRWFRRYLRQMGLVAAALAAMPPPAPAEETMQALLAHFPGWSSRSSNQS